MALAATILQAQLKQSHDWAKNTLGEALTSDQLGWSPENKASSIGAHFVHIVTTEDFFVSMIQGKQPMMAGDYAGKIGASEPAPQGDWSEWGRTVSVDMPQAMAYADAVFSASETYVGSLSDDELTEEIDFSSVGAGVMTRYAALNIVILNTYSHTGEVSILKGMQGLKGYPL